MKEEYFNELRELFANSNFDENVYEQILDKYNTWYDKLLDEGKSDEEIQALLKSPSEVVYIFNEKYKATNHNTHTRHGGVEKASIIDEASVIEEDECDTDEGSNINEKSAVEENSVTEELPVVTEESTNNTINTDDIKTATTKDTTSNNNTNPKLDPSIIVKTNAKGKSKYYKKRSFMGGLGMFVLFALVSLFVLPVLVSIFASFLSSSFFSLTLLLLPIQYIVFINKYGVVPYLTPEKIQSYMTNNNITGLILPDGFIDNVNSAISVLNQHTTFEFGIFLHSIIVALFGLAFLILFLFLTVQSFKLMLKYFSMVINKITMKRVEL